MDDFGRPPIDTSLSERVERGLRSREEETYGSDRCRPSPAAETTATAECGRRSGGPRPAGDAGRLSHGAARHHQDSRRRKRHDGLALFLASGCGGCHTLAAARTTGTAGPDLDRARPGFELVIRRVTEGGGGMPSFAGSLTAAQIRAIARFVTAAAR